MTQTTTSPGTAIVIERTFDASPEFIFNAFTDPVILDQWWGPHGYHARNWTVDLRVGGAYRYEMHEIATGIGHWCSGTYQVVEPNTRLTFTANIDWDPKSGLPEIDEMVTDIQFFAENGKTRMVASQSNLPDAGWGDSASEGWNQQFEKLEAWLGK